MLDIDTPPHRTIAIRQRNKLQHWTTDEGTYLVTMRLFDSIPHDAAVELARLPQSAGYGRAQELLDRGSGSCFLRQPDIAQLVAGALRHFHPIRYCLNAWCVMPNHVHVVFRTATGVRIDQVMHSWKSFTSKGANRLLQRNGAFWQAESYDVLIHDQHELDRVIQYVTENPVKAGLDDWPWVEVVDRTFRFTAV